MMLNCRKILVFVFALTGWSYANAQCSGTLITPSSNMTISANSYATSGTFSGTLTVNSGVTLCLSGTAAIAVSNLTNSGTINHTASGGFTASGDVVNSGRISTTTAGFSQSSNSKTLTNNVGGVFMIAGNITMEGDITNSGIIQTTGGTFTKTYTGTYYHSLTGGALIAYGNIRLEGTIENCGVIEISNSGVLTNSGTADPFTNSAGSLIYIKGAGLTTQVESEFKNYGTMIVEGNWLQTADADDYYIYANAYLRVCGNFTIKGIFNNYGTTEIMGEFRHSNASDVVNNYSGGVLNITDDMDLSTSLINEGCITIGDSLWKRNNSEDITIRNGGTIFAVNFIQDDGSLIGGNNSGNRGYLRVSGASKTLNGVPLSNYLDLTDEGHIGSSPYFDTESPSAYTYLTTNVTDGGTAPCTKATFKVCADAYAAGTGSCATEPLPIELAAFNTDCENGKVNLNWTTASESNNDYFTIERADDGINYQSVGIVDSKASGGNSPSFLYYSFTDNSFPKEESAQDKVFYYRLKQTDFNGKYTYSHIAPATCSSYCISDVKVMSDNNLISLAISAICATEIKLAVYNTLGQLVSFKKVTIESGNNFVNIDTTIASGLYVIKAFTPFQSFQEKFAK